VTISYILKTNHRCCSRWTA